MNLIKRFSNDELEASLKTHVAKERQLLHVILEHIKEFETRRLFLVRAYSSTYEYLTKECGYSGSAAMRRVEAARLLKEVPDISSKISEGKINLSQIGELSRAVKEKERETGSKIAAAEKSQLLAVICGKTTKETQKELAVALDISLKEPERQRVQKDDSVHLQLTLTKEQFAKLQRCKDLSGHLALKENDHSTAALIEIMCDQFLGRKTLKSPIAASVPDRVNKTVTPKTKKAVMNRDGCCQFVDPKTGKRCGSTFALEIDHRKPRWAGGEHAEDNLQMLCHQHNKFKYREEVGIRRV